MESISIRLAHINFRINL